VITARTHLWCFDLSWAREPSAATAVSRRGGAVGLPLGLPAAKGSSRGSPWRRTSTATINDGTTTTVYLTPTTAVPFPGLSAGTYQQQYLMDLPEVRDGAGKLLYLGAGAQFFPAAGLDMLAGDIINVDSLTSGTVIGYMFGGIAADRPNFGHSTASSVIFEVTYTAS